MKQSFKLNTVAGMLACAMLFGASAAQASVQIIGGLGNFDVYNKTGDSVDGFEIEIHGLDSGKYSGSWNYSFFGAPTVSYVADFNDASHTHGYRVTYSNNTRPNSVMLQNAITHFGIHTLGTYASINYDWMKRDANGVLQIAPTLNTYTPAPTVAVPTPAPVVIPVQVALPTPEVELVEFEQDGVTPLPQPLVRYTVSNDSNVPIWVLAGQVAQGTSDAQLADLMANPTGLLQDQDAPATDNALFDGDTAENQFAAEAEWELLDPGKRWTRTTGGPGEDAMEDDQRNLAMIFWSYAYTGGMTQEDDDPNWYEDCQGGNAVCGINVTRGALIGTMMSAVNVGEVAPVPVPASIWLFGSALAGFVGINRRKCTI